MKVFMIAIAMAATFATSANAEILASNSSDLSSFEPIAASFKVNAPVDRWVRVCGYVNQSSPWETAGGTPMALVCRRVWK